MKSPPRRMRLQWLSISAPMGFTALINFAITRWDVIAVGALLGMKDAATYSVASRVAILVGVFLRLLNIIISPVLANHYYRKEYQRYRRTILIATVASAMLGIPIYAFIFFYSEHLLALFGHEYIISIPILQILAFGQMCNVLTGPSGIALAMSGKEKHNFVFSCIGSTLSLVGIVLLTPKFGISGTAIATTSGVVLINLFQLLSCFIFVRNIAK